MTADSETRLDHLVAAIGDADLWIRAGDAVTVDRKNHTLTIVRTVHLWSGHLAGLLRSGRFRPVAQESSPMSNQPSRLVAAQAERLQRCGARGSHARTPDRDAWIAARLAEGWTRADLAWGLGCTLTAIGQRLRRIRLRDTARAA